METDNTMTDRIYSAIILNDYIKAPYAQWVKEQRKTIETRMYTMKHRGDLVICCGDNNSFGSPNAGRALCIVDLYSAEPMTEAHEEAACIQCADKRIAHHLRDWRYFSYDFMFSKYKVGGSFQSMFQLRIPDHIQIIKNTLTQ
jgi:ASC-1-like (ASCH) protein